jgi:hypothetical protein
MKNFSTALTAIALLTTAPALASQVNGDGFLTSEVIFGSGNADGSWTGDTGGSIEVALRGKLRFDALGNPQNIFNYDGIDTYTFDPSLNAVPTDRSVFNFEFSVNSDITGTLNRNVNDIIWNLTIDADPTAAIFNVFNSDPIDVPFADHAFGNNFTANGGGTVATTGDLTGYNLLRISNNVAQNSSNLGFGFSLDPDAPGIYSFTLSGSNALGVLASTSINIVVEEPSVVPLPATLPLLLGSVALIGTLRKRCKS